DWPVECPGWRKPPVSEAPDLRSIGHQDGYAFWYAARMSEQIAIRLPDDLADRLDALVATGRFGSKAQAVRAAIQALVEAERRREIGERIADGYRRPSQTDEAVAAASAAAVRSIREEPW